MRLKDAEVLPQKGRNEAAYYLAGYAVECALKACIAKQTKRHEFPMDPGSSGKVYRHRLADLLPSAELELARNEEFARDKDFEANYKVTLEWKETCRYEFVTRSKAEALLNAVRDRQHGVLRWLRRSGSSRPGCRKFVDLLNRSGVPITAALWQCDESMDANQWELDLVSPLVDEAGIKRLIVKCSRFSIPLEIRLC